MNIVDRDSFISSQASEKITLAHVEANTRLINWTLSTGSTYFKDVPHFVVDVANGTQKLTKASSSALADDQWFYSPQLGRLYVRISGAINPGLQTMVVTYRFFFADAPVHASFDLTDSGAHVEYDSRITSAPGYKHKIGVEQNLTSLIGSGDLRLENNDGGLDEIFDSYFFENRAVTIFSWNRNLDFSEARPIFRGRVTNKSYTPDAVSFTVKDAIFDLQQPLPQDVYTDLDNVSSSVKGRAKRWVYGRVEGLRLQSIDQIADGIPLTGTVAAGAGLNILNGTGTLFLSETSPGDRITIDTQEFTIDSVQSNTQLTLSNETEFSFSGRTPILKPEVPVTSRNREFLVLGHAGAELTKTVTEIIQLNRVVLSDVVGIEAGDFIEFESSGERLEVRNTAPGNVVVLRKNFITPPVIGSNAVRRPVQEIFVRGRAVFPENYTLVNNPNECKIVLSANAEFNIAPLSNFGFTATFTNGSRTITTTNDIDLREILSPRDFIRPEPLAYTTFYEILSVDEQTIVIRTPFADPSITTSTEGKRPDYIDDNTIVSANALGRTENNQPDGVWIRTAAQVCRDVIKQLDISDDLVNAASFLSGQDDNAAQISIALPLSPTQSPPRGKDVIDLIAKSTTSSVTLDNDLKLKFKVLLAEIDPNLTVMSDFDVISWSIKMTNNETVRNAIIRYRHKDIDRNTQEAGTNAVSFSSDFVEQFIGTNKTVDRDAYLFSQSRAQTLAHRTVYYSSLGRADVRVVTDLRFENLEIGDQVALDFARLYKRLGGDDRKKICVIIGKTVNGRRVEFEMTDLGNIFNRTAVITANDAPDFSAATGDDKLKLGFITDAQGIVDSDEVSLNTNLIN